MFGVPCSGDATKAIRQIVNRALPLPAGVMGASREN
jgi:hypothetical protein